jgi:hypothetical protein
MYDVAEKVLKAGPARIEYLITDKTTITLLLATTTALVLGVTVAEPTTSLVTCALY